MFSDLDLVTPVRALSVDGRRVPPGKVGTVIYAWDGGAEVEFVAESGEAKIASVADSDVVRLAER
ncbi:MAG: hypothetical protein REI11_18030 [Patulibacter sp.]|nr:hypothetical protein [Patulibacter sp.]